MQPTRTRMAGAVLVMAALCLTSAAPAQTPVSPKAAPVPGAAPGNTSAKEPIDITADHGEMFHDERRLVYTGNVEAIQGTDRLRSPVLTIFWAKRDPDAKPAPVSTGVGGDAGNGFGKIERMEAEGTVYFSTPTQNARGDHATYLAAPDTITMTGNVVLVQDKNVSTGDKLVIDRKTSHSVLYSNTTQKRVRGVFYQQEAAPAGASAAAPPPKPAPRP